MFMIFKALDFHILFPRNAIIWIAGTEYTRIYIIMRCLMSHVQTIFVQIEFRIRRKKKIQFENVLFTMQCSKQTILHPKYWNNRVKWPLSQCFYSLIGGSSYHNLLKIVAKRPFRLFHLISIESIHSLNEMKCFRAIGTGIACQKIICYVTLCENTVSHLSLFLFLLHQWLFACP